MSKPVMECRNCKRQPGEFHTTRCPHQRGGQKTMVEERHCYELTLVEGREIATQLVMIKNRLGQLGLFRTMHKLDLATKEIGYELADHPVARPSRITPIMTRSKAKRCLRGRSVDLGNMITEIHDKHGQGTTVRTRQATKAEVEAETFLQENGQ